MNSDRLDKLISSYEKAPVEFHATKYWEYYKKPILETIHQMELSDLRSGRFPILGSFGFNEHIFTKIKSVKTRLRILAHAAHKLLVKKENLSPHGIDLSDVREIAYRHCQLLGAQTNSIPIEKISISSFGNPSDYFKMKDSHYTMQALGFYIRYCFMNQHLRFNGNETIVELGSGSGHQAEILAKAYPNLTILLFDLPSQIFLCETYLTESLGKDKIVSTEETLNWSDLSKISSGKIHFFGNWQIPMVESKKHDLFINAASFGEMEPEVVQNYLKYIKPSAQNIYLLQARNGKELHRVTKATTFNDYNSWLKEFELVHEEDAYRAHMRLKESGGYFQALWKKA